MASKTAKTDGAARRIQPPATPLEYLEHALEDLGRAREGAGEQARDRIDAATDSARDAAPTFRSRAEELISQWEEMLQREADDVLVDLGKLAVRSQRTPGALRELSAEIRRCKADMAPAERRPSKATSA
jgi:hypothetical protein